jgi:hypothetical protein
MEENQESLTVSKSSSKSFTPTMINWLIALIVGLIIPLFSQDFVGNQIVKFSTPLPTTVDEIVTIADPSAMLFAALSLLILTGGYVIALGFQILYIAKLQTTNTVFSFALTLIGPFIVWLVLPYVFFVLT